MNVIQCNTEMQVRRERYGISCQNSLSTNCSIRIKTAPPVLAIHLKRFKYMEQLQRHKKLSYRIPFSTELRLPKVCVQCLALQFRIVGPFF